MSTLQKQTYHLKSSFLALGMRKARSVAKRSGAMERKRNLKQPGGVSGANVATPEKKSLAHGSPLALK